MEPSRELIGALAQQCCAEDKCEFPGLALAGTHHKCRHCCRRMHAPCGKEVKVSGRKNNEGGTVTVVDTNETFPIDLLNEEGRGDTVLGDGRLSTGYSEICKKCISELLANGDDGDVGDDDDDGNTIPTGTNATIHGQIPEATLQLFHAVYPEHANESTPIPPDVIEEMLDHAKDGTAGPEKWGLYERHSRGAQPRSSMQSGPGARLQEVRQEFTAAGVLKASKAKATFTKHQSNNVRFIIYLYKHHQHMLHKEIIEPLDDVTTEVDYTSVEQQYRQYKKNGGKKSLDQRKAEYLVGLMKAEICDALGDPGTTPNRPTINLDVFNENITIFIEYLTTECRNVDGGIQKETSYTGQRSSVTFLYRRYKAVQPVHFQADMKESLEGVKRLSSIANQHGEGNVFDGDRPLSWGLYQRLNELFLNEGTAEGLFGAAFSKLTCNLACRGKSTGQICTKQMLWQDDSLEISFGHIKDRQTGSNSIKKLPRNIYCNPLELALCPVTAIFDYAAMHPDVIANGEEAFFVGALAAQAQRFGRLVKRVCEKHRTEIENKFGFKISDIGVHSWRKCAHTKLNCGSTAGPTAAAACIRGGHSMGRNRDVYIVQEKASDQYCGRILVGLPEHGVEFAISYTDFVALDLEQSVSGGISEEEHNIQQAELDKKVDAALDCIFGVERLAKFPHIRRLLRIGLASHLYHQKEYDVPIDPADPDSSKTLPDSSPLRSTQLFANPAVRELKKYVAISMPWEGKSRYFKPASGIPPHILHLAALRDLKEQVVNLLPQKIEEMLDRRNMNGQLSMDQVIQAVENGPRLAAMANDIAALRRMNADAGTTNNTRRMPDRNARLMREFKHGENLYRRVPPSWKFPSLGLQQMYVYWHCGNESQHIPPMKFLDSDDVKHNGKRARTSLAELRKVMHLIDNRAKAQGLDIKDRMTNVEANTLYAHGESAVLDLVPAYTPTNRKRSIHRLKFYSVYTCMLQKKKQDAMADGEMV